MKGDYEKRRAQLAVAQRSRIPTREVGVPAPTFNLGGAFGGLPWSQFIDEREYAPELRWNGGQSGSTMIYERMQGDAQIKGLMLANTLPVRRLRWEVDPNGARPLVTDHVAEAFNLPIKGQDPTDKRSGFNHDRHLANSLIAPAYGHYHFERVYEIREDGLAHLVMLATRPPRTIVNFLVGDHGELLGIVQQAGLDQLIDPHTMNLGGLAIDANRLLTYVWDPADDGDQVGRSWLRPCYRNWLVKDRLIRIDTTKHERNGMGLPWFNVDKDTPKDTIEELAAIAEGVRSGTRGGGAGPGKLEIKGVEGQVPDTVASIRYHDQQMSRAFMALFFDLGTTETGSRALGSELLEFHINLQDSLADWYVEATQAQIDDECWTNWGPDEQTPRLTWTRVESEELALADLTLAVEKGLIVVDDEVRAYIGQRFKVPGQRPEEIAAVPAPSTPPALPPPAPEPPALPPAAKQRGFPPEARSALEDEIVTKLSGPMSWPDLAKAIGRDSKNGTARRARDQLLVEGAIYKRAADGKLAPMAGLRLPDRELHRNPKPFEVEAAVDFAEMERVYTSQRASLVGAVKAAQSDQIAELRAKVEAAAGNATKLATLSVEPVPTELIASHLIGAARAGERSAAQEHEAQLAVTAKAPLTAAEPDRSKVDAAVTKRAEATALTLAGGLATAASKRASSVATLPPAEAADNVATYLGALSDAALEEQLGGATMQGYNTGRRAYMAANRPSTVYASEIMDGATCSNCASVDGTEWASVAEAETSYPLGGFVECEGGLRCRGTLVSVY